MYGKYTRVIQKHSSLSIKIGFFPQSYCMYARLDSKSNTYVTLICLPVRNSALQKFIWFNYSDDNNFRIYMSCYMYTTINLYVYLSLCFVHRNSDCIPSSCTWGSPSAIYTCTMYLYYPICIFSLSVLYTGILALLLHHVPGVPSQL